MGILSSATRCCCCKNLLSCNLLRCACCCSWIRGVCGRANRKATTQEASDTKRKKKRKWFFGFCGGAVREREDPVVSSESNKKRKNPATIPEPEKGKWTNKIWKKKEENGLAALVKEISLSSNTAPFIFLPLDVSSACTCKRIYYSKKLAIVFIHQFLKQQSCRRKMNNTW
jgi:hypothetical protein